jgi:poly(3-hydroxybutyrate) depolymerase
MKRLIGAAVVAGALAWAGPASITPAAASPQMKAAGTSDTTDLSARRYYRRYYRPYYRPYYYARPYYYRPYPYVLPAPFPLGLGFGPFWW